MNSAIIICEPKRKTNNRTCILLQDASYIQISIIVLYYYHDLKENQAVNVKDVK